MVDPLKERSVWKTSPFLFQVALVKWSRDEVNLSNDKEYVIEGYNINAGQKNDDKNSTFSTKHLLSRKMGHLKLSFRQTLGTLKPGCFPMQRVNFYNY